MVVMSRWCSLLYRSFTAVFLAHLAFLVVLALALVVVMEQQIGKSEFGVFATRA